MLADYPLQARRFPDTPIYSLNNLKTLGSKRINDHLVLLEIELKQHDFKLIAQLYKDLIQGPEAVVVIDTNDEIDWKGFYVSDFVTAGRLVGTEGTLLDLARAASIYAPDVYYNDTEYAVLECAEQETEHNVVLYTDKLNISVPTNFVIGKRDA